MLYVIYGNEMFLIKKQIDKILNEIKLESININKYDLENTLLDTIIDDANSISLFNDKKIIIVDNAYIYTGTTNKKLLKQNNELLEKYLLNLNPNTILIFTVINEKLDVRKKIVKLSKEKGTVIECNKSNNINETVKKMFDNYHVDNKDINLIIDRVGNNLSILEQEINKIKTYKGNDLNINHDDIINLTNKNIDTDLFVLIENIVTNNKEKAIESYSEMIKLGEEPIVLLISLANQFRIIYQVKKLSEQGYSEYKIADFLNIHSYRVKKALEKKYLFTDEKLLYYIEKLADLDFDIKSGKIDKNLGLELFILT